MKESNSCNTIWEMMPLHKTPFPKHFSRKMAAYESDCDIVHGDAVSIFRIRLKEACITVYFVKIIDA